MAIKTTTTTTTIDRNLKASSARRHLGAALFLGTGALAAQAQEAVPWKTFAQAPPTGIFYRLTDAAPAT